MHICMFKIFFTYMNGTMAQLLVPVLPEVHSVKVHHYYRENTLIPTFKLVCLMQSQER